MAPEPAAVDTFEFIFEKVVVGGPFGEGEVAVIADAGGGGGGAIDGPEVEGEVFGAMLEGGFAT